MPRRGELRQSSWVYSCYSHIRILRVEKAMLVLLKQLDRSLALERECREEANFANLSGFIRAIRRFGSFALRKPSWNANTCTRFRIRIRIARQFVAIRSNSCVRCTPSTPQRAAGQAHRRATRPACCSARGVCNPFVVHGTHACFLPEDAAEIGAARKTCL